MPAGRFTVFSAAIEAIAKGTVDLDNDAFVVTLHGADYTPAADAHTLWADVAGSEVAGAGYTPGGRLLLNTTVVRSGAVTGLSASNVSWINSSLENVKWAVVTRRAGAALTPEDLLLGYVDLALGDVITTRNGNLSIYWSAMGILTMAREDHPSA